MSSAPDKLQAAEPLWEELVKTALLGTARAGVPPLRTGNPADKILSQIKAANEEAALLQAAIVARTFQRCGMVVAEATVAPLPVCGPQAWPRCSPGAGAYLAKILRGEFAFLLPEFLTVLKAAQRRVPEELLPELLEAGRKEHKLRPQVAEVVGQRGQWLAQLNEDWNYIVKLVDKSEWETAPLPDRIALFRSLRGPDPGGARDMLVSTWKQEPAENRVAFISEMEHRLSASDESFLEAALDDRRKEVRHRAAELLMRLPGSALTLRMIQRLTPLVRSAAPTSRLKRLMGGNTAIEITLPEACSESMQRDGVEPKPPEGIGEKAWWLLQMVAAVPPAFWNQHLQLTAAECVAVAAKSEYEDVFLRGWATSSVRHRDAAWGMAILEYALEESWRPHLLRVIEVVPPAPCDHAIMKLLKKNRDSAGDAQPGLHLLQFCPAPWSETVGRAVLELLRHQVKLAMAGKLSQPSRLVPNPERFATSLPISLADEIQEGWPEDAPAQGFFQPLLTLMQALQFRSRMLKEIRA